MPPVYDTNNKKIKLKYDSTATPEKVIIKIVIYCFAGIRNRLEKLKGTLLILAEIEKPFDSSIEFKLALEKCLEVSGSPSFDSPPQIRTCESPRIRLKLNPDLYSSLILISKSRKSITNFYAFY